MKIFIDTAEIEEIKQAYSWGIVDGVTTNPSLIKQAVQSREEVELDEYIADICEAVEGPVSLEVIGLTSEKMVEEGKLLYEKFNPVNDNVVVKIPINTHLEGKSQGSYEGLEAIKELSQQGIPVNTTLIMKPEQALLAAKAGADFVSPFAGRVDDYIRSKVGLTRGEDYQKDDYHDSALMGDASQLRLQPTYNDLTGSSVDAIYQEEEVRETRAAVNDQGIKNGVHLVKSIRDIFDNYDFDTELLAASTRNSRQVREIAEAGADVSTIPFKVIQEMVGHYKTEQGIKSFSEDVVPEYKTIFE